MHKVPPMKPYQGGETHIDAADLNNFDARLRRLENLSVSVPLILSDNPYGRSIALDASIMPFMEVELVDDLPPYGAAKAALLISEHNPTDEIDWDSLTLSSIPPSPSEPKMAADNLGLLRGLRTERFIPVHDNLGIASWRGDRGLIYKSRRQQSGRWMFMNPCPGDQVTGTLLYNDTVKVKDFEFPSHSNQKQYIKFAPEYNSNPQLFTFKHDDPPTIGGDLGHGWYIQIARKGMFEVQANLSVRRTNDVAGADHEAKYAAQSYMQLQLEYFCSTSWQLLDRQYIYLPFSNTSGGSANLFGKFFACQDAHGVRLRAAVGGSSGNLRLDHGQIHIKRVFHNHTQISTNSFLGNDGVVAATTSLAEASYQENFEDYKIGDFDENWVPAQGAEPPKYNSGYPSNDNNPQWPELPL